MGNRGIAGLLGLLLLLSGCSALTSANPPPTQASHPYLHPSVEELPSKLPKPYSSPPSAEQTPIISPCPSFIKEDADSVMLDLNQALEEDEPLTLQNGRNGEEKQFTGEERRQLVEFVGKLKLLTYPIPEPTARYGFAWCMKCKSCFIIFQTRMITVGINGVGKYGSPTVELKYYIPENTDFDFIDGAFADFFADKTTSQKK